MMLNPMAMPRCSAGKASVRMAVELAIRSAPPTPWITLSPMSVDAPSEPVNGMAARPTDARVKMANPALYIRTRPKMSPIRPSVTTSTAVTTMYPWSSHKRYPMLDGSSGSRWIPLKMAGSEMMTIDWLSIAMKMPNVVLDSTIHLWRSEPGAPGTAPGALEVTEVVAIMSSLRQRQFCSPLWLMVHGKK